MLIFKETIVIMNKQNIIFILFIVCVGGILTSCSSDNSELEAALAAGAIEFTVNAGDDQSVELNDTVYLNGDKCFDPDGNSLDYSWEFVSTPNGSTTSLLEQDIENPTFDADIVGIYKISLTVYNGMESKSDEVEITVNEVSGTDTNTAPVANAGDDFAVSVNNEVNLNGTRSSDADPDDQGTLTYTWHIVSGPDNYTTTIIISTTAEATFTPDKAGSYEISLTVNDGKESHTDTITVTVNTGSDTPDTPIPDTPILNNAPVANAGVDQVMTLGSTVTLNGTGSSDPDAGDTITYLWRFVSRPPLSTANLNNSTSAEPTFIPDMAGSYNISLTVNDGKDSNTDTMIVTASTETSPDIQVRNATNNVILNGGSFNYINRNVYSNTPATFTIYNTGTANLSISSISLVSGDTSDYTISTSGMSSTVLPNGNTSFSITFSPTVGGTKSAIVRIANNDETHEFSVTGFAFDYKGIGILDSQNDVGKYSSINVENGRVYICYYDETRRRVRFARSFNAGIDWSKETIPCIEDVGKGSSMVVDGNYIFISTTVTVSTANDRIGMIQSVNSGSSWNTIQILEGESCTSNGYYDEFMTSIAVDGKQIYISYLASTDLNLHLLISDSYNPFTNWTNNNIAPPPGDIENGYHSSMHTLNGKVYLSHSGYNEEEVYFTSETDDATAPFATRVVDHGNIDGGNGYTSLAYNTIGANVHFYIAYYDQSEDNQNLKFARLINNESKFSKYTIDNTSDSVGQYPSIAVSQDTIYVCYYDEANQNLKLARSFDDGVSWNIQVVDNSSDDVGKFTSLAVEETSVYISYYDQTNKDLKFAKSFDGGNTWN